VIHVEAHGTGTRLNDRAEALALRAALGPTAIAQLSVGAIKAALGHWIAGAGALGAGRGDRRLAARRWLPGRRPGRTRRRV
jgi:3-oxoacyl-(acyl-carrier-protein) synthase